MKTQINLARIASLLTLFWGFTFAGISPATAGPIIYATGEAGSLLLRIDVGTGDVTVIGSFGVPGKALGITFNPEGAAYTVSDSGATGTGNARLANIDPSTGMAKTNGPVIPRFMGIAFSPQGTLYAVNPLREGGGTGTLYTINPATGAATRVGEIGGAGDIMDLAFHPDGTLYGIEMDGIFRVDPATGTRTFVIKPMNLTDPMGLVIDRDGTFYASDYVPFSPIVRIDITTGQTTPVVKTTINYVHGLDIMPAPTRIISRVIPAVGFYWFGFMVLFLASCCWVWIRIRNRGRTYKRNGS